MVTVVSSTSPELTPSGSEPNDSVTYSPPSLSESLLAVNVKVLVVSPAVNVTRSGVTA